MLWSNGSSVAVKWRLKKTNKPQKWTTHVKMVRNKFALTLGETAAKTFGKPGQRLAQDFCTVLYITYISQNKNAEKLLTSGMICCCMWCWVAHWQHSPSARFCSSSHMKPHCCCWVLTWIVIFNYFFLFLAGGRGVLFVSFSFAFKDVKLKLPLLWSHQSNSFFALLVRFWHFSNCVYFNIFISSVNQQSHCWWGKSESMSRLKRSFSG